MKTIKFLLLIATTIFFAQCKNHTLDNFLSGEHKIRKMAEGQTAHGSGSMFFLIGGSSWNSSPSVSFAWEMNDGSYALTTLPFNKVRVKFCEDSIPTVVFNWESDPLMTYKKEDFEEMINAITNATINVRQESWPTQIHLPMNTKDSLP